MSHFSGDERNRGHLIPALAEIKSAQPPADTYSNRDYIGHDDEAQGFAVILADLFSNAGVERNISRLIAFYANRFSIPCCYVEGATGGSDFYTFEFLSEDVRHLFCERLLQQGYLTGAELFCVDNPEIQCDVYGVDSPTLYRIQAQSAAFLQDMGARLARTARSTLAEFMAAADRIPADFKSVAKTIDRLFACIDSKLTSVDLVSLLQIAANYPISMEATGNLPPVVKQHDLENLHLWLRFAWAVEESIARQLKISGLLRLHQLLVLSPRAFALKLTNPEQSFVTPIARAATAGEITHEAILIKKAWNLSDSWLQNVKSLSDRWKLPNTFYYCAIQRSRWMAHKIAEKMGKTKTHGAIVFTGGFHSPEIARYLWDNHRIKSVVVHPTVQDLADGIFYDVRICSEMRGWTYAKALLHLTPSLILRYGPVAYVRKLVRLAIAQLRLQLAKRVQPTSEPMARQIALSEGLQMAQKENVLFVEIGDLQMPWVLGRRIHMLVADQFAYFVGKLDMPGCQWVWNNIDHRQSSIAPICCLRSHLPICSSSMDDVIWIPRFFSIREVDCFRAITEMVRILRPAGTLRVWLRPGGNDTAFVNALDSAGGCTVKRSGRWLLAQKGANGQPAPFLATNAVTAPVLCIRFISGNRQQLEQRLAECLNRHGTVGVCHRNVITGLDEDLVDPELGLHRPAVDEVQSLLVGELEEATLSGTLTLLIATKGLLELVGGVSALARLVADHDWSSRIFLLIEGVSTGQTSNSNEYFCPAIADELSHRGEAIAEAVSRALGNLRNQDFRPNLPEVLLRYIACPECLNRPRLALQVGYFPPHHSDGVLMCPACDTAYHIRDGVPEATALAEMRDMMQFGE